MDENGEWGGDSQLRLPAGCLLTAETRLCDISPDICGDTVTCASGKQPRITNWTARLTVMRNQPR